MARIIPRLVVGMLMVAAAPAAAQVDPLLFVKTAPPNVLFIVDTSSRMQRDAATDSSTPATLRATSNYYDPITYTTSGQLWEPSLGFAPLTSGTAYRRLYVNLDHASSGSADKFLAPTIRVVRSTDASYGRFEAPTRLAVARAALYQAVTENRIVARFGLLKMRQASPTIPTAGNSGPVAVADPNQQISEESPAGRWAISRPEVTSKNGTASNTGVVVVAADSASANSSVLNKLAVDVNGRWRGAGAAPSPLPSPLLPVENDDANTFDTPLKLMLDDARVEVARLIALNNDPTCRNTVAIMIVGGGEGNTAGSTNADLATAAGNFLNISNRRVPVYVIALAPPASDVAGLRAVATTSGGQYFEITKAQIDAALASPAQLATNGVSAPAGTVVVPEVATAVNLAIQHAFATAADVNTAPTVLLPIGPISEFQVTSPIIGTVNLDGARDINGQLLVPDSASIYDPSSNKIPQRSNLIVTTGFALPGFDGRLKGFRVYKPVADSTQASGYKFQSDGTALWVACVPGTGCPAEPDNLKRNLYTAKTDGTMIAFTEANVADLAPLMNLSEDDAKGVIRYVRAQPLGAIVGSTPAIMNPPSLDPPPDDIYRAFADANKTRRSIVWVGTNNGILEAIDARFGVEVWGFIPLNLLPKLRTLRDGQSVGSFDYFVDQSAKIADVKYDGAWRTHLISGQGPGGTFYQSFDVSLNDMATVLGANADTAPTVSQVLSYFASPSRITLNWAFPSYASFDPTIAPYGDLKATASALEKSVGQTWSDPAVGQIGGPLGPYTVLVGSGFLLYSVQQQTNRGGAVAGITFYLLNVKDGTVYDSREVTTDGVNETNSNCLVDNADGCTKSKNALQTDPVATGPSDSRYVTKSYIGDLDGNLWRFDIALDAQDKPIITTRTMLYNVGSNQPIFNSMATVNVGGSKQYVFFGTGSDLLPQTASSTTYRLLGILDNGATGSKTVERVLLKTSTLTSDERVTAFPAVSGDIVFFTTTTLKTVCTAPDANLYAFTFIGGPAYDNTGDDTITAKDTPLVKVVAGQRATAPYIVDQHLVMGVGGSVSLFGDPADFNNGIGNAGVRILSWREGR